MCDVAQSVTNLAYIPSMPQGSILRVPSGLSGLMDELFGDVAASSATVPADEQKVSFRIQAIPIEFSFEKEKKNMHMTASFRQTAQRRAFGVIESQEPHNKTHA